MGHEQVRKFQIESLISQYPNLRVMRTSAGFILISDGFPYQRHYQSEKQVNVALSPRQEGSPVVKVFFRGFGEKPRSYPALACLKFCSIDPTTTEVKLTRDKGLDPVVVLRMAKAGLALLSAHRDVSTAPERNLFYAPPANPDKLGDYRVEDALLPPIGATTGTELAPDQKQLNTITSTLSAQRLVLWRKK